MNPYTQLAEQVNPAMDERIDDIVGRLDPEQRRVADVLKAWCSCGWSLEGPTAEVVAAQIAHRRSHGWQKRQALGKNARLKLTAEHAAAARESSHRQMRGRQA